jgi:AraC-like DNA-binding protein
VFKKLTGFHLPEYINVKRVLKAKDLLLMTEHTISFIAGQCGFESVPHFHRIFKACVGLTPGAFRSSRKSEASHA